MANTHLLEKVNHAINKIRPYLQSDGGDVEVIEITNDLIVKVKLIGACESCPFSAQTLKAGIEMSIKNDCPEIKGIIAL